MKYNKEFILERLKTIKPEGKENNERENAQIFAECFQEYLRYNSTRKQWFLYTGTHWKIVSDEFISKIVMQFFDTLLLYVPFIQDPELHDLCSKEWGKLGRTLARKNLINDSKALLEITENEFDKDNMLLNLRNCVLDFKNGEIKVLKHEPSLYLSKICNVTYDETAECPQWKSFIENVMQGDQEKIHYLQKVLGYALTGLTEQETFWILYGATTRNGKSTLIETISYLLGEEKGYSVNMNPETLAQKKKDSSRASGDIARLKGARLVVCSEPPKRMLFDIALVKTLLGRDTITARQLYQEEMQFKPDFKLIMNTNYLPVVQDNSLFTSGRVNVITFDKHFEPHEQDKKLKSKLRARKELSGILNWLLEGLEQYFIEGVEPPKPVEQATQEYRQDSDKVGQFIAECLEPVKGVNSKVKDVYEVYMQWCDENGYGTENKSNFTAELRTRNLIKASGKINGISYKNIVAGYAVIDFQESDEGEKIFSKSN